MQEPAELVTVTQKRYRCRHIHAAGHQCGSPALRNEQFCYYHHTTRRPAPAAGKFRSIDATEPFNLPVVEDRASALSVASQLLNRMASNDLDPHRAGTMLYSLQIITALLPREPRPAVAAIPEVAPTPEPLLEYIIPDETYGTLAPIAELVDLSLTDPSPLITDPSPSVLPTLRAVAAIDNEQPILRLTCDSSHRKHALSSVYSLDENCRETLRSEHHCSPAVFGLRRSRPAQTEGRRVSRLPLRCYAIGERDSDPRRDRRRQNESLDPRQHVLLRGLPQGR
jgi:hypothetical protein